MKFLKENIEYFHDLGQAKVSQRLQNAITIKEKKMPSQMNWKATDGEKLFAKHTYDKGLVPKLYKELLQLNGQKM